jgi:signal transduction histidine kinase
MNSNRATVLILSSDPAFARQATASWPEGGDSPEFVVLKEDLCRDLQRDTYDLAIADCSTNSSTITDVLITAGKPAILVHSNSFLLLCGASGPVLLLDRQEDTWPAIVGVLAREIVRREQADRRAREVEQLCGLAEAEATLGRYMIEMRHTVSNALTSVLGNAELLLHEPGLPGNVLAEADTVRNMALRLNEVFQRFFSIEKELSVAARESPKSSKSSSPQTRAATAR